jgi:hypothetical protein
MKNKQFDRHNSLQDTNYLSESDKPAKLSAELIIIEAPQTEDKATKTQKKKPISLIGIFQFEDEDDPILLNDEASDELSPDPKPQKSQDSYQPPRSPEKKQNTSSTSALNKFGFLTVAAISPESPSKPTKIPAGSADRLRASLTKSPDPWPGLPIPGTKKKESQSKTPVSAETMVFSPNQLPDSEQRKIIRNAIALSPQSKKTDTKSGEPSLTLNNPK